MHQKEDYIAVFDSGVGGISVLRQLIAVMPNERYLYFGDSANAPYGTRSSDEVRFLTMQAVDKLIPMGIKALVVACNTATAAAVELLRRTYPELIVVGIEPAVKVGADRFPGGTVGVMATPLTMESQRIHGLMDRHAQQCRFISLPTPGLADLVEAGKAVSEEAEDLLRPLLLPLRGKLDALVLGCTHYPFAAPVIQKLLGENTVLLDGGEGTAREAKRRLEAKGLLRCGPGEQVILSSAEDKGMTRLCRELLEWR